MRNQVRRTAEALQNCLKHALQMSDRAIAARDLPTAEFAQNWAHFIWYGLALLVGDSRIPEGSRNPLQMHVGRWKQFAEQWNSQNYNDLPKALANLNIEEASLQAALTEILKS
jgi:hypothetical protein